MEEGMSTPAEVLGPNMYGYVPLRCCAFYPVWEHFLNLNTLYGSKITIAVLSEGKDLQIVYPFRSIFAENDTLLGSKNGENDTLPSGTYPVPKILKYSLSRVKKAPIAS